MMRTVVTGAAGFLGRALTSRMADIRYEGNVVLADMVAVAAASRFESIAIDLQNRTALGKLLEGADRVIHLAALPGGAAEADPETSRAINLEATLDILDLLATRPTPARLVCAGSIAVFGGHLPDRIDDDTPVSPTLTYGTHKAMAELAVADRKRRGEVDGVVLRLPGLLARPDGAGFRSAFTSTLFTALLTSQRFAMPVGPDATMWLMSAECAADALLHAISLSHFPGRPVLTAPALRITAQALVKAAARATGSDAEHITHAPDAVIEEQFGALPTLTTAAADRIGFRHDGDVDTLAARAVAGLRNAA